MSGINGQFNYVIREDGALVVGRGGHIDLSRGAPVQGAGEFRVVKGEVRMFNNFSGHYQPSGSGLEDLARQAFEQQAGLPVGDGAWVAR